MAKTTDKKKDDGDKCKTPVFRVMFANVFRPKGMENDDGTTGTEKYSLMMLFDEDADLSKLKKMAMAKRKEVFGNKKIANFKMPFRDGEEKEDLDGFEPGMMFATASSQFRPGIVDRDLEPILEQSEFYSGCYARATVHCYTYKKKGNVGVSFGLNNIQKVRDGESVSGHSNAAEDFDEIDEDEEDDDFLD